MNRGVLILSVCFLGAVSIPACGDKGTGEDSPAEPSTEAPARDPAKDAAEKALLEAVIDEHYSACRAGDLDRIFATFTAEMVGNFEQQIAQIEENRRETMSYSYKTSYEGVEHKILTVSFDLPAHQGESYSRVIVEAKRKQVGDEPSVDEASPNEDQLSFLMVKRNGTWVIAQIMSRHQQEAGQRNAGPAGG